MFLTYHVSSAKQDLSWNCPALVQQSITINIYPNTAHYLV